jgi:hypothetical protein
MLTYMRRFSRLYCLLLLLAVSALLSVLCPLTTYAASSYPPETGSGSVGLQGTISENAPTQGATIVTPVNGTVVSAVPVTVNGLCPSGLLVKIFSNNVFVGSVECTSGSYSIPVDLFAGENQLVARVYDALDQAGPDSNSVTVQFNDTQLAKFGSQVSLTSIYAKRGADPGSVLSWPIILSGGTGPYAVSVDWGDGTSPELLSESFAGVINIMHTYKTAGVYNVIVKVTDANGNEAFLELVGVANGAIQEQTTKTSTGGTAVVQTKVEWWPAAAGVPLIFATFWVGRRAELYSLRKSLEKSRNQK